MIMFSIAVMVLRYLFLALMLLFIFRLVKLMVADLRLAEQEPDGGKVVDGRHRGPDYPGGDSAFLRVKASVAPSLRPGTTFPLNNENNLLGRGDSSDLVLQDSFASNRHARIFYQQGQYWIEDLQSTNGTFVNEVRIDHPTVLAEGDSIRIGDFIFEFVRWGYEVGSVN
jgi:pSer/pThr/pTyr-binding forkhead associated (FHA) protein